MFYHILLSSIPFYHIISSSFSSYHLLSVSISSYPFLWALIILYHLISCSIGFYCLLSSSTILFPFLSFSIMFYHFLSFSIIFYIHQYTHQALLQHPTTSIIALAGETTACWSSLHISTPYIYMHIYILLWFTVYMYIHRCILCIYIIICDISILSIRKFAETGNWCNWITPLFWAS